MTGWELFWFAVLAWLVGDGMGKLGRETAKRVKRRRDMRRLAAISFDRPRVHTGTPGGISFPSTGTEIRFGADLSMSPDRTFLGFLPRATEHVALEVMGQTIFTDITANVHTVIVPRQDEDGAVGSIRLKRTSECIPNGDRLAVVFR
jgi:hypothetical protein